jgi:LysR family transcriptional regulator (chromosome initiation inhibitor)
MIDYRAARAVAMVVRSGSFEGAARLLGVTPSAVSQRVRLLEERIGTVLIERGHPCVATEPGARLCRHVEGVGLLEEELFEQMPGLADPDEPGARVTIEIATNADSLGTWFLPAVAAFTRESGRLAGLSVDDEGHTADWLRRGRVQAAVTALATPVAGCRVIALGALRYHATASPEFRDRYFAGGVTVEALARAPALTFDQKDRLQHEWIRRTFGQTVVHPSHRLPSTHGFVAAALAGMGWGLNPAMLVAADLADGRLVELVTGAVLDVPLFWQVNRLVADRLAGLTRQVVATARGVLQPIG